MPSPLTRGLILVGISLSLSAADSVVVDGAGVMAVTGAAPSVAPTTGEVKIGGGTIRIGGTAAAALTVAGGATLGNATVTRSTQATAQEVVRGDDPRLSNARPANGGNAATVGGKAPTDFVSAAEKGAVNGVATLDATGKVPAAQLPTSSSGGGGGLPMWDAAPATTQSVGNGGGVSGSMAARASFDVPLRNATTGALLTVVEASIPNVGNLDFDSGAVSAVSFELRTTAGALVAAEAPLPALVWHVIGKSGNNTNVLIGDVIKTDPASPVMNVGINTGGYMGSYQLMLVGARRALATAAQGTYVVRVNVLSSGSFHNSPPLTVKAFY